MNTPAITLWILCLCMETIGQLVFKAAALKTGRSTGPVDWQAMLSNVWIWLGICCYVIEFLSYMAFLSLVPLAQGVLLSSLSIMTIMLGGGIFFGEKLSTNRVVAGMLIAIGVALVGWC